MKMKNPPHPGRIVRQECIELLGLTVTEAARALGVTRQALNNLVNLKAGVSPEMAIRLSKAFGRSRKGDKSNLLYRSFRGRPRECNVDSKPKRSAIHVCQLLFPNG